MNSKLLYISSKEKTKASRSNTDFTVQFAHSELQNCKAISVKSISFPNAFPNINESNNLFNYRQGGVLNSVSIPIGFYSLENLINTLNGLLPIAIQLNELKQKLSFGGAAIQYLDSSENPMANVLGIMNNSNGDVNTYDAEGYFNLTGVSKAFVQSQAITSQSNLLSGNANSHNLSVVDAISVDVPLFQTVHFISNHEDNDLIEFVSSRNLQNIDIKLTDHDGNVLDLGNLDLDIVLKVYF